MADFLRSLRASAKARRVINLVDAEGMGLTGAVLGVGKALLLIHRANDDSMSFTGFSLFPIDCVQRWRPDESFVPQGLSTNGSKPSKPPNVPLDDLHEALQYLSSEYPLVLVYRELMKPGALWAGRIAHLTNKTVTLEEISPKAKPGGSHRLRLADVTRIDFDGPYEKTLWTVATRSGRRPGRTQ